MLAVVGMAMRNLTSLVQCICLRPLKRLWCWRLKTSDLEHGVPLQVVSLHSPTANVHLSAGNQDSCEPKIESWDMWDSNQLPQTSYNQSQSAYNKDSVVDSNSSDFHSRKLSLDLDPEPEPDYFQDMAPEVKRSKKIFLKRMVPDTVDVSAISDRLSAHEFVSPVGSELQPWVEQGGSEWNSEVVEDLSSQANEALRDKRRSDHKHRSMEHQRRKLGHDASRCAKKDNLAVKIS